MESGIKDAYQQVAYPNLVCDKTSIASPLVKDLDINYSSITSLYHYGFSPAE